MLALFYTTFCDIRSFIVCVCAGSHLTPGADLPQVTLLNSCRRTRLDLYMLWNMFIVTIIATILGRASKIHS